EYVGIDNARLIYQAAKHPKSYVSLDSADHLLSERRDANYVANVVTAWVGRYLPEQVEARENASTGADEASEGTVRVMETRTSRYQQTIDAGPRHRLVADEPRHVGGDDLGPNPYDLLLAALGACTNMTLRMYAERKEWPLDRVTTTLHHEKIHARDCKTCQTKEGKIDHIERTLVLEGDLDDAQRKRLMEIADKCPVHRTLHSENSIVTRLEEI